MATFRERAAHSVDRYVFFVFRLFVVLVVSRFGFEGGILILNAPVPGHCILVTSIVHKEVSRLICKLYCIVFVSWAGGLNYYRIKLKSTKKLD